MAAVRSAQKESIMPGAFRREDYIELHYNPFDFLESDEQPNMDSFDFFVSGRQETPKRGASVLIRDAEHLLDNPDGLSGAHIHIPINPFDVTSQPHIHGQRRKHSIDDVQGDGVSSQRQQTSPHTSAEPKGSNASPVAATSSDTVVATAASSPASASVSDGEVEVNLDVDWTEFSPPALLGNAPGIDSRVLLRIVASSIENVKAKAEAERRQRNDDEELRLREERIAREEQRNRELFLPIIINEDAEAPNHTLESAGNSAPEPESEPELEHPASAGERADASSPINQPVDDAARLRKRKFALKRLFRRGSDKVEGEAVTGTRETLRERLRAKLKSLDIDSSDLSMFGATGLLFDGPDTLTECVSCLDEFPSRSMVRVPCHHYCSDCFVRLISAAMQHEQQWPAKCCLNPIPFRTILRAIPDEMKTSFQERSREWNIPISERVYCHNTDCGVWIRPDHISPGIRQGRCENGHWTCTICRGPIHGNNDCPEDPDMRLTNNLAEEEGWKRCSQCSALVEHKEACQHMTCRCGNQFCYVCGQRWRTCDCSVQQLQELKDGVASRRRDREFREQEEAEELRRILAQIEEFERQEALRLEQERQEQERLEEERRQREIEERAIMERIRRQEVEEKYQQLRQSLAVLHDLQRAMLESLQLTNTQDLEKEVTTSKEDLARDQALQQSRTTQLIQTKLITKEAEFDEDFAMRVSEEQKIEDDYHRQLLEYWAGQDGGAEAIEASMLPLRQRMDEGYRSWQAWKAQELASYRETLENQRIIVDELMYSARQRLDDRHEESRRRLKRQVVAEGKWLEEVVVERERLLDESEGRELEGGEEEVEEVERDADWPSPPDAEPEGSGNESLARDEDVGERGGEETSQPA